MIDASPQQLGRALESDTMVKPETSPGVAFAENGIVTLDGPDGVAVTMTPDAARKTAMSMLAAADLAATQSTDALSFD